MSVPSSRELPSECDVLVVGAGPAGSACATRLAQQGWDVLLIDQQVFPRDKICGDALIPDAHAALIRLGAYEQVMQHACVMDHVTVTGPRAGQVDVPARVAVLPRQQLDDLLCRHAREAGARFVAPVKFLEPWVHDGRVRGARLQTDGGVHLVRARWVVLATGAQPQPMLAADLCQRRVPSGIALRGYIEHPEMARKIRSLQFVYKKALGEGYGWIFPGPDGVFNIGVGLIRIKSADARHSDKAEQNLNQLFQAFCDSHAPAAQLVQEGRWVKPLRGAPLRCSLQGASAGRPGLLATGEAVGSTYSLTGEGIGKALETGLLCADALLQGGPGVLDDATEMAVRERYEASLHRLVPRFELYERANRIYDHPWLMDLLIWRARRSPRLLRHMSGLVNETSDPTRLFSWRGLRRLLLG
mgnify:CR=1 FL=1